MVDSSPSHFLGHDFWKHNKLTSSFQMERESYSRDMKTSSHVLYLEGIWVNKMA